MASAKGCCGMHVTTSAKVVSLVGSILSLSSLLSCTVVWIYTPISIAFLLSFILVIFGVKKNHPTLLLVSTIILAITIFVNTLLLIASIIIGFIVPKNFIRKYHIQSDGTSDFSDAKKETQIACFVLAFILFAAIASTIFAILIINKARKYIIKQLQRRRLATAYPLTFITLPPPYSPNPPPPMYSNDDYNPPPLYFEEQIIAPPAYSDTASEDKRQKSFFRRKLVLICYSCNG